MNSNQLFEDIISEVINELNIRNKIKKQVIKSLEKINIEEIVVKYLLKDVEKQIEELIDEDDDIYFMWKEKVIEIVKDKIKKWE